jgi:GR25 family glycosyltransferase involved in LPS biosynthesis
LESESENAGESITTGRGEDGDNPATSPPPSLAPLSVDLEGLPGGRTANIRFHLTDDVGEVTRDFCRRQGGCDEDHRVQIESAIQLLIKERSAKTKPSYPPSMTAMLRNHASKFPHWDAIKKLRAEGHLSFAIVLNLDRSSERLEHITEQCRAADIRCFRYSALDGDALHMTALRESGILSRKHPMNDRGNVAVALSHMSMWRGMVDRGIDSITVFEDDVYLLDNKRGGSFEQRLARAVRELPDDGWNILHLGVNPYMCADGAKRIISSHLSVPTHTCYTGFFGYVISRQGAVKSLAMLNPLDGAIDNMLRDHFGTNLTRVYLANSALVAHDFQVPSEREQCNYGRFGRARVITPPSNEA